MTTQMYLPEMVSYDIAVIAKLMLWLTNQDIVYKYYIKVIIWQTNTIKKILITYHIL